ncbi:hypothetical protein B0H16DRAFT_1481051 [Mycena metata]|uniref:Uncharacterized protein n=1 Tax=Mycena metata TaxID=1033252 RepID=A0AAD7MBH8_9AGAR|nr:hypothetical protein B0H16DRAFT_1481051 [Mycena metata]
MSAILAPERGEESFFGGIRSFNIYFRTPRWPQGRGDHKASEAFDPFGDSDNDSWDGGTGTGDSKVFVTFEPGQPPILCRRSRLGCKVLTAIILKVASGASAWRRILLMLFAGTSTLHRVTPFWLLNDRLAEKKAPQLTKSDRASRNHKFWVGCSDYDRESTGRHRSTYIPDDVDEPMFVRALNGRPLVVGNSKDTPPCSAIVHPTTGLRRANCPHSHIVNGHAVTSAIIRRPCSTYRTIFVPDDATIRMALIVHPSDIPHNHPIPVLKKASIQVKESYRQAIRATGTVGATVAKVDNGITPAEFAPALQDKRVKQKLVHDVKMEQYPAGLGAPGAFKLFWDDMQKPLNERYLQRLVTMPDGGTIILTCLAALMRLLDDTGVTSFKTDTTFQRVLGDFNEWEVVVFVKAIQRAVTIARAYVNGASAQFYERLFDEFRAVKLELTAKPIAFKRLVKRGNIIAMNSDMEAAQVLGGARSLFKSNDTQHSGLSDNTPAEEFAPEIIKLCTTHAKRAVLDFKSLVSQADYDRLIDFVYIDSAQKLEEFSGFVKGLGIKKIQDWWDHKAMSPWILPCLIKSQSPMSAEDWDNTPATTNTGEGQHHWTNVQIGTKQSLVEAIENARKLDERVAHEIAVSLDSGILVNSQNESYHRRSRNTNRQTNAAHKLRESHEVADERAEVEHEIQTLQAEKQDAAARLKELRTRKSALGKKSKGSKARSIVVSASSSGRVKTRTIGIYSPLPPVVPYLKFFVSINADTTTVEPTSPVASTSALPPPEIRQTVASSEAAYHYSPPTTELANNSLLPPPAVNGFNYFPQTSYIPSSDFGVYVPAPTASAFDFGAYAPAPTASAFGDYGGFDFEFDFTLLEQFGYVPMENITPAPNPSSHPPGFTLESALPTPVDSMTPGFDTTTFLPSDPIPATSSPSGSWPKLPPVPVSSPTPSPIEPASPLPPLCAPTRGSLMVATPRTSFTPLASEKLGNGRINIDSERAGRMALATVKYGIDFAALRESSTDGGCNFCFVEEDDVLAGWDHQPSRIVQINVLVGEVDWVSTPVFCVRVCAPSTSACEGKQVYREQMKLLGAIIDTDSGAVGDSWFDVGACFEGGGPKDDCFYLLFRDCHADRSERVKALMPGETIAFYCTMERVNKHTVDTRNYCLWALDCQRGEFPAALSFGGVRALGADALAFTKYERDFFATRESTCSPGAMNYHTFKALGNYHIPAFSTRSASFKLVLTKLSIYYWYF